jgi:hypothetical protein
MTQTVILTQPVRVSGSVLAAGTTQTLAKDIAADLVARGFATPSGNPTWIYPTIAQSVLIENITIPFLIMPGDGSANGCQFTGTLGAFTLSAAIIANVGASLSGCYAYFSANFGGSTLPAGWYWTEFSSDTAGIVYSNTYSSGRPLRPATKTAFAINLTGFVTGSTAEIVAINSIILRGGTLGKNGALDFMLRQCGSTAGNKTYRAKIDTTTIISTGNGGSPVVDTQHSIVCVDSNTIKTLGRTSGSSPTSIGSTSTAYQTSSYVVGRDT